GIARVGEDRSVVVDIARAVEETDAFGRADRVGETIDDVAAPAFAHVRNALDEPRHRGEASAGAGPSAGRPREIYPRRCGSGASASGAEPARSADDSRGSRGSASAGSRERSLARPR